MNVLTPHDLQVLSDYHFIEEDTNKHNDKLLGVKWVKKDGKWSQELVEVNRQDVTYWFLFLSLLGIGKLKHTSVYFDNVCSYLHYQYDWKEIKLKVQDKDDKSTEYQAFKTVCHLANRQMQRILSPLFKKVSDPVVSEFYHYWNPAMDGRTLFSLQRYRLPDAQGVELRFIDSQNSVTPYQALTEDDVTNIEVGFECECIEETKTDYFLCCMDLACNCVGSYLSGSNHPCVHGNTTVDHDYHHFPIPPYYQVNGHHLHYPPTRNEL